MSLLVAQLQPQTFFIIVLLLEIVTGVVQLMRLCRMHLLLHLIPSPSGFFVAGLEGGGPRDEKSQRRRCISARFLSLRGIQSGGCISTKPSTWLVLACDPVVALI
jgi:hypothetical protein